jgi:cytosine/adenosine deaminase-related metal-dependent hydrolase
MTCSVPPCETTTTGWADDIPIERWFNERVWRVESALTAEDVRWSVYLAAAEMIRSGAVGFADHYFDHRSAFALERDCIPMDLKERLTDRAHLPPGLRAKSSWPMSPPEASADFV